MIRNQGLWLPARMVLLSDKVFELEVAFAGLSDEMDGKR
jgi:hypothetical protein